MIEFESEGGLENETTKGGEEALLAVKGEAAGPASRGPCS
jgi:hypothetical protein